MPQVEPPRPRTLGWVALPVALFGTIAILFAVALKPGNDPSRLPSVFIGKPAPAYTFASIPDLGSVASGASENASGATGNASGANGFDQSAFGKGSVTVLNFFASWCAPCVEEHPQLVTIGQRPGVTLAGVNVKDDPSAARQFLNRYGNPYAMLGADRNGRGSIEWGVYGTPETFILNGRGQITYKHVGPIGPADLDSKIFPAIEAAKK